MAHSYPLLTGRIKDIIGALKNGVPSNVVLDEAIIIEINENLADTYAEIDAFSQRRNPAYADYPFVMLRNMGKNDLWIASTDALLGLILITTGADFDHLNRQHGAYLIKKLV